MSTVSHDITKDFYNDITVALTTGTQSLKVGMANEILQLIVIPPSDASTYKFYIEETMDNLRIFEREEETTGTYNELVIPALPVWGNHNFVLYDATNGTYKLRMIYR